MRPSPRLYLFILFAPLTAIVCGCVLFNLWIDPQDSRRYQRLSTHTYTLPALLTELERPPASEPDIEVFLLGTSRTPKVRANSEFKALNLGIAGADDGLIDNLLTGLLQTSTRSHVYFVDAMGGRRGKYEGKVLLRYLVNSRTTHQSLHHIANEMRKSSIAAEGSPPDHIVPQEAEKEQLRRNLVNLATIEYLQDSLLVRPNTKAAVQQRIERISKLAVPHDALVVYYEGPHSPWVLDDPLVLEGLQERSHLWRRALAELKAAELSTSDGLPSSDEKPRVTVVYASYATPTEWGEPALPEVWSEDHWLDALHFDSTIGEALLDRLRSDTASEPH